MDAESVRKTLKIYNLTTANVTLMKPTTIIYLHVSVNPNQKEPEISFFDLISRNFKNMRKAVTYVVHWLTLHHWQNVCTNWADLGECSMKNHTEQVQLECYANI